MYSQGDLKDYYVIFYYNLHGSWSDLYFSLSELTFKDAIKWPILILHK